MSIDYGVVLATINSADDPPLALRAFVMQEREHSSAEVIMARGIVEQSGDVSRDAVMSAMRMLRESNPSPNALAEIERIEKEWTP